MFYVLISAGMLCVLAGLSIWCVTFCIKKRWRHDKGPTHLALIRFQDKQGHALQTSPATFTVSFRLLGLILMAIAIYVKPPKQTVLDGMPLPIQSNHDE